MSDTLLHHPNTITLDLPAQYMSLNVIDACLMELLSNLEDIPEPSIMFNDIRMAVQEACMSIINQAYADILYGRIRMSLLFKENQQTIVIFIKDTGHSLAQDITTVLQSPIEENSPKLFSLYLLRALMDDVTYTTQSDGNHWLLVRHLRQAAVHCACETAMLMT